MTLDRKDYKTSIPQLEKRLSAVEGVGKKGLANFDILQDLINKEILERERQILKTDTSINTITVKMYYLLCETGVTPTPETQGWSETMPKMDSTNDDKVLWYMSKTFRNGAVVKTSTPQMVQIMDGVFAFINSVSGDDGWTTIDGDTISTGRIQDHTGDNYFDLDDGTFNFGDDNGNYVRQIGDGLEIYGTISANSTVGGKSMSQLIDEIEGNVNTWFYAYVPTLSNAPASTWSAAEKDTHLGDLFYNTSTGKAYRFMKSGSTYSWDMVTDTDITTALSRATSAYKRTQKIYYRKSASGAPTAPSGANSWVTTNTNVYNQWTTKVPPLAQDTASGRQKYPYLYTCEQFQKTDDSDPFCSTVLLDENTTVIDGGQIITNSITSNEINTGSITVGSLSDGSNYSTTDEMNTAINAKKSVHTLISSNTSGNTYANILTWAKEGRTNESWGINTTATPLTNVKIGDTCRVAFKISNMGTSDNRPYAYVVGEVTNISGSTVYMTMHGLASTVIDGGNIIANSIGADQIAANSLAIGKLSSSVQTSLGKADNSARYAKLTQSGTSADATAKPWFKIASVVIDATYTQASITFDVSHLYTGTYNPKGKLNVYIRKDANGYVSTTESKITWTDATEDIKSKLSDFVIAYKPNDKPSAVEVWVRIPNTYWTLFFKSINETYSTAIDYTKWTLYTAAVSDAKASITSGYSTIASKVDASSQYVTKIDDAGIFISPANQSPTTSAAGNSVRIDGNGMKVYKGGTPVAQYGASAIIGSESAAHSVIDADGQRFYASNGTTQLANIGYASGSSASGTATAPYYDFGVRKSGTTKGNYSVAEGGETTASGYVSHSQNMGTIASKTAQTAIGTYNIEDTSTNDHGAFYRTGLYAFIIGNGTNITRSNAFTVTWRGNVEASGEIHGALATPTISISTSTGSLQASSVRRQGNFVHLLLTIKKTSATNSGDNVYVGTINTTGLRPVLTATGGTYFGSYALNGTISTDGTIVVRNADSRQFAAMTSNGNISFTYLVN